MMSYDLKEVAQQMLKTHPPRTVEGVQDLQQLKHLYVIPPKSDKLDIGGKLSQALSAHADLNTCIHIIEDVPGIRPDGEGSEADN